MKRVKMDFKLLQERDKQKSYQKKFDAIINAAR